MADDPWAGDRAGGAALLDAHEELILEATLRAMRLWLAACRALILDQQMPKEVTALLADGSSIPDVDAAQAANAVWARALAAHVGPAIAETFGEGFAATSRAADISPVHYQDRHMADVFDRLKIWPEGAFEELRPELQEAVASSESIEQVTDRVGRVLDIDAPTRAVRADIDVIDKRLADVDNPLTKAEASALRKQKRELWTQHDERLQEWRWKARRIARTEVQGAIEGGALASAQATAEVLGAPMFKKWLSTSDERTRHSHSLADGQIVPVTEKFRVGKSDLDHPADPRGRAEEIINCRCTMTILDADEVSEQILGKWGGRGVSPMSARLGPDAPEDIDAGLSVLAAERKGEDVKWPAAAPESARVVPTVERAAEAPADVLPDLPAERLALVEAGRAKEAGARKFVDTGSGGRFGSDVWNYHREEGKHPFTAAERETVSTYSEWGYSQWSGALRGRRAPNAEDLAHTARLESAIEKAARVPEDIVVTRSLPADGFDGITADRVDDLLGRVFVDQGFMSTSIRSTGAAEQIKLTGEVPYTMRLTVPEGSRGLFVSNVDRAAGQPLTRVGVSEAELILPPGGRYAPHSIELPKNPGEPVVVHATYTDALQAVKPAVRKPRSEFAGRSLDDLSADMAKAADDEDFDLFDRLAVEVDRREEANRRGAARREAGRAQKMAAYEKAIDDGLDDESAIEKAFGISVERQRVKAAIAHLRSIGCQGRNLEELVRDHWRDRVAEQMAVVENSTEVQGYYWKRKYTDSMSGQEASLWTMSEKRFVEYASDELRGALDQLGGRVTQDQIKAELLDPTELRNIQSQRRDYLQ